jgi:hypothetical protein
MRTAAYLVADERFRPVAVVAGLTPRAVAA